MKGRAALLLLLIACKKTHPPPPPPDVPLNFGDASFSFDAALHRDAGAHRDASLADGSHPDAHGLDAPLDGQRPPGQALCSLGGAVVWSGGLPSVVPGGPQSSPDLTWLKLPDGYCAHFFATVPEARQLRVSPSGDLFVASPGRATAGGASGGLSAIVVLPDDDHDGVADAPVTYLPNLVTTQGMLFYGGDFYYQNEATILKTPWTSGQRVATGPGDVVLDFTGYASSTHWPKVLDADDSGHIYVTNGGDQGETCTSASERMPPRPFHGGILEIVPGNLAGQEVARGLRNPYALRCAKGTGQCFALELSLDGAGAEGAREKLVPVRQGDDWGFPCCATAGTPFSNLVDTADPSLTPDCSGVAAEQDTFVIDHTPFALDFEQGLWTGTFERRGFVALHGFFESWVGARILAIATDPATGLPVQAQETDAGTATMTDFATGWDDGLQDHGRPAALAFGPDGRLYIGDDQTGLIVWVAQVTGG